MRRRHVLALGAAVAGIAGCNEGDATDRTTPLGEGERTPSTTGQPEGSRPPDGTPSIGGSLNGRPYRLEGDIPLIETSETRWLHAFLDVRKKYDGGVDPESDPDVTMLRRAIEETGVNLIVSLLWDFSGMFEKQAQNLPAPGSDRETGLFEYATEMLTAIDQPIDIIVLGNEPVWETLDEDIEGSDPAFAPFVHGLKDHLVSNYTVGDPRYLVGAFNRLYDEDVRRDYHHMYREFFRMAREDDDIDGIDLHIHYLEVEQAEEMLEIARNEVPDGLITATEFSPVFRYMKHYEKPIGEFEGGDRFADRHGVDADATAIEYLEAAKADRLSPEEMGDFMETMPWYNVDFVEDMYDLLNRYDVSVGTFGFLVEDDVHNIEWTDGWYPFPINCLFQPAIIDSKDGAHPHYLDDFRNRV